MASLKVLVSSTCYDFWFVRERLRGFIESMGHEAVLSDEGDVFYNPDRHTHTSCVDEVENCDLIVLLIGGRAGGEAVDEAMTRVDLEELERESNAKDFLTRNKHVTITQLEVLRAIRLGIPVYTFIDQKVMHEHHVYTANRRDPAKEEADGIDIDKVVFPSIEKQEWAKHIFNFIDYLRLRRRGNAIEQFRGVDDIEKYLLKQWSGYFHHLLREQRRLFERKARLGKLKLIDDICGNWLITWKTELVSKGRFPVENDLRIERDNSRLSDYHVEGVSNRAERSRGSYKVAGRLLDEEYFLFDYYNEENLCGGSFLLRQEPSSANEQMWSGHWIGYADDVKGRLLHGEVVLAAKKKTAKKKTAAKAPENQPS